MSGRSLGPIDGKRLYVGPCPGRKRPVLAIMSGTGMTVVASFATPDGAEQVVEWIDNMVGAVIVADHGGDHE